MFARSTRPNVLQIYQTFKGMRYRKAGLIRNPCWCGQTQKREDQWYTKNTHRLFNGAGADSILLFITGVVDYGEQ